MCREGEKEREREREGGGDNAVLKNEHGLIANASKQFYLCL